MENKKDRWEKDVRANLLESLVGKKSKLEKALYSRIYYTKGIAAYVSYNPDITNKEYYELAKEFIGADSVINSMALSKNCIINAIYPLKGHETAIGLNLLDHKERREIVEKTIETHKTFVAGPVELVEGGIAFISYTPIFDKTNPENSTFWGMTDIVIKRDAYLKSADFVALDKHFKYALKGVDGKGDTGEVFFGDESVFEMNPVLIEVNLPYGNWILGAVPLKGWSTFLNQDEFLKFALYIASILISVLIWFLIKSQRKIMRNAKEQHAILSSLDNIILELNNEGRYLKIAPTKNELLYIEPEKLLGKTVYEIFDKEMAEFFHSKIKQCLKNKELVVFDYPLNIKGEEHWFEGRIFYKSKDSTIYSAYDITEHKKAMQELEKTNKMKDRLFSILAHDLRNPIGTCNEMVHQLFDNYDDFSDEERKHVLASLNKSGDNTIMLLENLLNWSGKSALKIEEINMFSICNDVIDLMSENIANKAIMVINAVDEHVKVNGDLNASRTIIRNLLSNAVKFTRNNGEIRFESTVNTDTKQFIVRVIDNGVGMTSEQLHSLFVFGKTISKEGTRKESGSGLGLMFCKDFAATQNGDIWAESEVDKGSVFYFSLPLA